MAMPLLDHDKYDELTKRRDFAWLSARDAMQFAKTAKLPGLRERGIKDALFARRMAHIYQAGARKLRSKRPKLDS